MAREFRIIVGVMAFGALVAALLVALAVAAGSAQASRQSYRVSVSTVVAPRSFGYATARCRRGWYARYGGYHAERGLLVQERESRRAEQVEAWNGSRRPLRLQAVVLCERAGG